MAGVPGLTGGLKWQICSYPRLVVECVSIGSIGLLEWKSISPSIGYWRLGILPKGKGGPGRVVRVRSWSELPEILEPGTYYVNGRRVVVYSPVSREALRKTSRYVRRGGVYA